MRSRIEGLNSTSSFIKNIDSIHTKCHAIPAHPFHVSAWKTEQNKKKKFMQNQNKKAGLPSLHCINPAKQTRQLKES